MASQWFCRVAEEEMGPVTFQKLAELMRSGTLTEDTFVRGEYSDQWIKAREVVGLVRTAGRPATQVDAAVSEGDVGPLDAESELPAPRMSATARLPTWTGSLGRALLSWRYRPLTKRGVVCIAGVFVVLLVAAIWGWQRRQSSRRFPEAMLEINQRPSWFTIEQMRAPRPKQPSVPQLKEFVPQLVPGLEQVYHASAPSLSANLCTIVFSAARDLGDDEKLYIATRRDVSQPFGKPKRIESLLGVAPERHPALSPDGLELIFLCCLTPPQLWYARRSSVSGELGAPVRWKVEGLSLVDIQTAWPHFSSPSRVVIGLKPARASCTTLVVERADRKSPFKNPLAVPVGNGAPPYFVSEDGMRAYFHTRKALYLTGRKDKNENFVKAGKTLAPISQVGELDGPVWVAPHEDVIFYSSVGPGKERTPQTKLWMMRF